MNILKNVLRVFGGQPSAAAADNGLYFYVKAHRCDEVIQVRLNLMNDLSHRDDENGVESKDFFVHKTVVGRKCYDRMEAEFVFDQNRKLTHKEVLGGVFVDEDAYRAYQETQG
jgi:hypothetical protein